MTDFEIIRAADHRRMAWKNGGGSTAEIAAWPEGSSLDDFEWRLSMADVEQSGSFSSFPGVDRTIAVLDGAGLLLAVEGSPPANLNSTSKPYAFSADLPTSCQLIDGAVKDLNIMTRRAAASHTMRRVVLDRPSVIELAGYTSIVFCVSGAVSVSDGLSTAMLGSRDTLIVGSSAVRCVPEETASLLVMEILLKTR